jgi:hypothetical protein
VARTARETGAPRSILTICQFTGFRVTHFRVGSRLCENSDFGLSCRKSFSIYDELEKNSSASYHRKKKSEKTILRILCSRAFSHSLGHHRKLARV